MERHRSGSGETYFTYSREEEIELVLRWRSGDQIAGRQIVDGIKFFVRAMAQKYLRFHVEVEELVAEGMVGIAIAMKRWDETKGIRLMTYASHWAKCFMLERCMASLPLGHRAKLYYFKASREVRKLRQTGMDPWRAAEIVAAKYKIEARDVDPQRVLSLHEEMRNTMNLPYGATLLDAIEDRGPSPEEQVEARLDHEELAGLRKVYERAVRNDRDRAILELRLLADEDERWSLEEIADKYGVTRERIRQLEVQLKERLRTVVENWRASKLEAKRACRDRALVG